MNLQEAHSSEENEGASFARLAMQCFPYAPKLAAFFCKENRTLFYLFHQ